MFAGRSAYFTTSVPEAVQNQWVEAEGTKDAANGAMFLFSSSPSDEDTLNLHKKGFVVFSAQFIVQSCNQRQWLSLGSFLIPKQVGLPLGLIPGSTGFCRADRPPVIKKEPSEQEVADEDEEELSTQVPSPSVVEEPADEDEEMQEEEAESQQEEPPQSPLTQEVMARSPQREEESSTSKKRSRPAMDSSADTDSPSARSPPHKSQKTRMSPGSSPTDASILMELSDVEESTEEGPSAAQTPPPEASPPRAMSPVLSPVISPVVSPVLSLDLSPPPSPPASPPRPGGEWRRLAEDRGDNLFSDEENSPQRSATQPIRIEGLEPDSTLSVYFDEALLSEVDGFKEFDIKNPTDRAALLETGN